MATNADADAQRAAVLRAASVAVEAAATAADAWRAYGAADAAATAVAWLHAAADAAARAAAILRKEARRRDERCRREMP